MKLLKKLWDLQMEASNNQMATVEMEFIGGHPNFKPGKVINMRKDKNGKVLFTSLLGNVELKIVNYSWGEQSKRSAGKAATGAIIGGALTGGVGLIAGAAIGGKRQDNSVLHMSVEQNGVMYHLQFRADQKKYNEFIKKVL